jgi:C4-dicarboxylate-specific signal transduction histidine kinase
MLDVLKSQLGSSIHSVKRFLERPISVRAGGVSLGVTPSNQRQQARDQKRQRDRLMKRELYALLEQHPSSRQLMRHLDLLERTLRKGGLDAVEKMPVRVLMSALTQLERLVWDWSAVGLAELRSRIAVMIKTRPPEAVQEEALSTASIELELAGHADVSEVDHATFEAMERSWVGEMPAGVAAAKAAASGHQPD